MGLHPLALYILEHNLYLWDTNSYYNTECEYNFLVKNVRFFVNAYWCPTSKAFSQYTPCTSMFIEEKSKIAPKKPTESNEIYNYNLTYEIEDFVVTGQLIYFIFTIHQAALNTKLRTQ